MVVTAIPTANIPLIAFASAGHAIAELDKETDSFASWRGYVGPSVQNRNGGLAESVHFAKYMYTWAGEGFVVYCKLLFGSVFVAEGSEANGRRAR